MKGFFSNNKGFTLVELIIAVAILGIVMSLVTSIFVQTSGVQRKITRKINYQDAATNIISEIKTGINNTNYLTLTDTDTATAAAAANGTGRVFVKGDYDGIYFQDGISSPVKKYGISDLDNTKMKVSFICDNSAEFNLLTVKLAFYPSSTSDADITADITCDKAEYTYNSTIYLQNLAFGIRVSDAAIEAQKAASNYYDSDKTGADRDNIDNSISRANFEGKCIKYKVVKI